jgi:uncharacterized protein (DUF4415 family)
MVEAAGVEPASEKARNEENYVRMDADLLEWLRKQKGYQCSAAT